MFVVVASLAPRTFEQLVRVLPGLPLPLFAVAFDVALKTSYLGVSSHQCESGLCKTSLGKTCKTVNGDTSYHAANE